MDGINDLLDIDRRVLVHPLHHPDDHKTPFFIDRGEGAELVGVDGRRVVDGLSRAVERQYRARARRIGRCGGGADAKDRVCLGLCRADQRAGDPPRREDHQPRLFEQLGGLFHHRRRGIERERVQVRALFLEDPGQAEQDQDHLAHPRLSRRHDGGDERDRDGRRTRRCSGRWCPASSRSRRPTPIAGRATRSRASARPRRSRRRSSPRAPTPSPRSSPSRSWARAASSCRPRAISRSCARSATATTSC